MGVMLDTVAGAVLDAVAQLYPKLDAKDYELVLGRAATLHKRRIAKVVEDLTPLTPAESKAIRATLDLGDDDDRPRRSGRPETPIPAPESDEDAYPAETTPEDEEEQPSRQFKGNKPKFPDLQDRVTALRVAHPGMTCAAAFRKLEKVYGGDFMSLNHFQNKYWKGTK